MMTSTPPAPIRASIPPSPTGPEIPPPKPTTVPMPPTHPVPSPAPELPPEIEDPSEPGADVPVQEPDIPQQDGGTPDRLILGITVESAWRRFRGTTPDSARRPAASSRRR